VLADPVVRNRGTMGGSLCQADPAEDLSGVVTALKGEAVLRGPGGAERRAGDFAIVAASAALWVQNGKIVDCGLACSAVGPTTMHIGRAEDALVGQAPSEDLFAQCGQMAAADCSPNSDGRGPADYKRHVAGVLTTRALSRAAATALR
jgi:carbon-monoxide dehydrogenase medium subunit